MRRQVSGQSRPWGPVQSWRGAGPGGEGPHQTSEDQEGQLPSSFRADAPHSHTRKYDPVPCSSGGRPLLPSLEGLTPVMFLFHLVCM